MKCGAQKIGLIVAMLILFVGCSPRNSLVASYTLDYGGLHPDHKDNPVFTVDNITSYKELITTTVDIHTFAEQFDICGGKCINDVMEQFGIECLRLTDKGALYSVHKVKQGGLLYVFYSNYEWDGEIANNQVIRWFYERERFSFEDIADIIGPSTTIQKVAEVLETEQVFLNVYQADPDNYQWMPGFQTHHYLADGILEIVYAEKDGEMVLLTHHLTEDFNLRDIKAAKHDPYDAHILEMDWVE